MKAIKIDPNKIKTRDYLMLQLIQGVTKSGIVPDRKKEQNRKECRRPFQDE